MLRRIIHIFFLFFSSLRSAFVSLARAVKRLFTSGKRKKDETETPIEPTVAKTALSLRLWICLVFSVCLVAGWLAAATATWVECRQYLNEFFDTQQMLFAKTLATLDVRGLHDELPSTDDLLDAYKKVSPVDIKKIDKGDLEEDALGFAIFDHSGRLMLSDDQYGRKFIFSPKADGFTNSRIKGSKDEWRIVWLPSVTGRHVVAVGQELEYRQEMAFDMLFQQLAPWAMMGGTVLLVMLIVVSRSLAPVRAMTKHLVARKADDYSALPARKMPSEIVPLIRALNGLFARMGNTLLRERSFIGNAAHELRTPLAALRIQAEVARVTADEAARDKALQNLLTGIDRSNRLVEQLLVLSRLEALRQNNGKETAREGTSFGVAPTKAKQQDVSEGIKSTGSTGAQDPCCLLEQNSVDLQTVCEECLLQYSAEIAEKEIAVEKHMTSTVMRGDAALFSLFLRNLIDNAIRYTPHRGLIRITLDRHGLLVENSGAGVAKEDEGKLGQPFFRPPGQKVTGSGLGLSIVRQIAQIYGFTIRYGIMGQPCAPAMGNDSSHAGRSAQSFADKGFSIEAHFR